MHEGYLTGEHGTIRYQLSQPRRGVPVLLIHGYGALIEHWQRFIPILQEAYTPCAFDLYNFGSSARLSMPPRKEIWAAQAAHVINSLLQEPVVVIGHSMGGMVAAQLTRDYPDLVRGLVLINSAGLPFERPTTALEQQLVGMTVGMSNLPGIGQMLAGVSAMAGSWAVYQGLLSSYYRKDRVTPELVEAFSAPLRQPDGLQACLTVSHEFDTFVLDIKPGDITTPTMIIWGREDYAMPPEMAAQFQQLMFPQAELHLIPWTGHSPFDEDPAAVGGVLLPWLDTLKGGNRA
jgi:pimeloyl-ACP methyl ester carboxylesterase